VTEKPEDRHNYYRDIRTGQTCYLTIGQTAVCRYCAGMADAIRLASGLMVEVEEDRIQVNRGSAASEVFHGEVRHLVDALVQAADFAETADPWSDGVTTMATRAGIQTERRFYLRLR
jgi:hypothetical protein